jgi:hypothetical protein
MQRTVAPSRIEKMQGDVGSEINQLTAIRNAMDDYFVAVHCRGVEAATAASTRAGLKGVERERSSNHRQHSHRRNLNKVSILNSDSIDQLNFEFARNKNSMTVFMIRLRRVYRA